MNRFIGFPAPDASDLAALLEDALNDASLVLNRSAVDLGATAVAVLLTGSTRIELTYFWNQGESAPPIGAGSGPQIAVGEISSASGLIVAQTNLGQRLREWLSPSSQSFLLFPWKIRQRIVSVLFCFSVPRPPISKVPLAVAEKLSLVSLATFSVKEFSRLNGELKAVNRRLSGRVTVDQAKGLLQAEQGLTEAQAYQYLRELSRHRRLPLAAVAAQAVRELVSRRSASLLTHNDSQEALLPS